MTQIIPRAIDGEEFEYQDDMGTVRRFRLNIEDDTDHGAPWEECDGHGIVSDWTTRDKRPWERVLNSDRGSKRYYDVRASLEKARREGWNAAPYGGTPRQQAARAVDADFEYLRAWCNDEWRYVGVVVTALSDDCDCKTDYGHSVWGIESESTDYIKDTALELARECSIDLQRKEALQ